jgi:hypothetical protein
MKKLLLALALFLLPSYAVAQCNGVFPNNTVCGNITGANNTPRPTAPSAFQGSAGGANGQIQYNSSGSLAGFTMSGDCIVSIPNITCTKTSGVAFGGLATLGIGTGLHSAGGNLDLTIAGATGDLQFNGGSGALSAATPAPSNFSISSGTFYASYKSICGKKVNYVALTAGPSAPNDLYVNNLNQITLCLGGDYVGGPGVYNNNIPGPLTVQNFDQVSFACGAFPAPCQAAADINFSGVSTINTTGGLDTGSAASNTDYCLWMVSKGTTNLADIGVVWSANCGANGPANPVATTYPYFAYMGWNHTNNSCPGSSCAFINNTLILGDGWVYFVGGAGGSPGVGSGAFPQFAAGVQTQWTGVSLYTGGSGGFVSSQADAYIVQVENNTTGHAAVAPNVNWGSIGLCDVQSPAAATIITCGPFSSNTGSNIGLWSTSSGALFRLVAFHDGQI